MDGLILPAMPPVVAGVFGSFPAKPRSRLLELRELIFATAATTDSVGPIEEVLKWGEPAYLTTISKSGSTIRLGWKSSDPHRCAIYLNCQTSLIATFRDQFADELAFEGNRAILIASTGPIPEKPLAMCFAMALTYHRRKQGKVV